MILTSNQSLIMSSGCGGGSRRYIPDGWFDYSDFGNAIKDTNIIPIKTPLKKAFNNGLSKKDSQTYVQGEKYRGGVPLEEEFSPTQLVERLSKDLGRELFAVIDLTNTFRYYNCKELNDLGVKYKKIKCPGREIPSDEIYREFSRVLSAFLKDCKPKSLVAVHCTHGLNRTGYLVCRYLIEENGLDVETAIKEFNEARGYKIERENYLKHLRDGCPSLINGAEANVSGHDSRCSQFDASVYGATPTCNFSSWSMRSSNEGEEYSRGNYSYYSNSYSSLEQPLSYFFDRETDGQMYNYSSRSGILEGQHIVPYQQCYRGRRYTRTKPYDYRRGGTWDYRHRNI